MKKEIRVVDESRKILQVTTISERWYYRQVVDSKTGLPKDDYVPSVTWICDSYPKGIQFYKWLASKGWDEAEAIKNAAGEKGSRVHYAIKDLIEGREIPINARYKNSEGVESELTLDEYDCLMSFALWVKENKPEFQEWEFCVWGDGYAGTVDLVCKIGDERWLVDFKTGQSIWPSYELQLSAYKKAGGFEDCKLAILQVGYRLNKKRFKFTEIKHKYQEFLAAKLIWANENSETEPKQRDYPLSIKL